MGIRFLRFCRRENRRSLASFDRKEIAHLGAIRIAQFCGGERLKIAAATAENRAILVHSLSTEIITEVFLERAGPIVLKTWLLELIAFRQIPVVDPARTGKPENYWK